MRTSLLRTIIASLCVSLSAFVAAGSATDSPSLAGEWIFYQLSAAEAAMVLGTSIEYNISEVADRNVGVVAKIRKSSLSALPH